MPALTASRLRPWCTTSSDVRGAPRWDTRRQRVRACTTATAPTAAHRPRLRRGGAYRSPAIKDEQRQGRSARVRGDAGRGPGASPNAMKGRLVGRKALYAFVRRCAYTSPPPPGSKICLASTPVSAPIWPAGAQKSENKRGREASQGAALERRMQDGYEHRARTSCGTFEHL